MKLVFNIQGVFDGETRVWQVDATQDLQEVVEECMPLIMEDPEVTVEEALGESVYEDKLAEETEQAFLKLVTSPKLGEPMEYLSHIELCEDKVVTLTVQKSWVVPSN